MDRIESLGNALSQITMYDIKSMYNQVRWILRASLMHPFSSPFCPTYLMPICEASQRGVAVPSPFIILNEFPFVSQRTLMRNQALTQSAFFFPVHCEYWKYGCCNWWLD